MGSMRRNSKVSALGNLVENDTRPILMFGLKDKLTDERFNISLAEVMDDGLDFTFEYIQSSGFKQPLLFPKQDGLGMKMPKGRNFSVKTVCELVGRQRVIHVQCCRTQTTIKMTMADFVKYYCEPKNRGEEVYNVLSLEFTGTKLDELVKRPKTINDIDWIDLAYPKYLRDMLQNESVFYHPKVQKYCLMSVAGSYTTFHVDFGGTSVWYHVLKGKKIFWLIEPTDVNMMLFEEWQAAHDDSVFFGDLVEKCQRVELEAGNTFMIPSGWIHAVYTPVDSLVFGGNFLHSYSIPMQQCIVEFEERRKVPTEQRFPYLNKLQWFVIERYVYRFEGKSYLDSRENPVRKPANNGRNLMITHDEREGLSLLVSNMERYKSTDNVEGITDLEALHNAALEMLAKLDKVFSRKPYAPRSRQIIGNPQNSTAQQHTKPPEPVMSFKMEFPPGVEVLYKPKNLTALNAVRQYNQTGRESKTGNKGREGKTGSQSRPACLLLDEAIKAPHAKRGRKSRKKKSTDDDNDYCP